MFTLLSGTYKCATQQAMPKEQNSVQKFGFGYFSHLCILFILEQKQSFHWHVIPQYVERLPR